MVDGEHKFVMEYAADKIARALGKTLVAPVITYVPEGSWENPGGHMGKPGTITLPEDRFVELLVNAGRSLKSGGFTTILFLGESGGNRTGMRTAATRLNELFKGERARVLDRRLLHEVAHRSERVRHRRRWAFPRIRSAGTPTSSTRPRCCSSIPKHVRKNKLAPGGGYENSGVSGDPTKSTPALGKVFLQIKIDNALAQIKGLMAGTHPAAPRRRARRWRRARRRWRTRRRRRTRRRGAAAQQAAQPAGTAAADDRDGAGGDSPSQAPDTVFIDELTWEETRDAIKAGKTTVIIPTGGTEKNGYHMVLGKHNFIVTHAANLMARRLKNALVAPTIQYVPEGNPDRAGPGVISLPSPAYDHAARRRRAQPQGARLQGHPLHRRQRRQSGAA